MLAAPGLDANGNLALKVTGVDSAGYTVERSANLQHWTLVKGAFIAGDQLVIPLNAKTDTRCFFRLKKNL